MSKEVLKADDYLDQIGCIGWFWSEEDMEDMVLDVLDEVLDSYDDKPYFYTRYLGRDYLNFKPCTKEEIEFKED